MTRHFLGLLVLSTLVRLSAAAPEYRAGTSRIDITPDRPIWLSGYGDRSRPSEGVEQPLFTKALAIQWGQESPLVVITADILGFPQAVAEAIAGRIQERLKIPRDRVLLVASHTHTGPVVGACRILMFDLKGQDAEAVRDYTAKLEEKCAAAAMAAVTAMKPARLAFGRGKATFAVNRRIFRPEGVNFGVNPTGVVDHEVPILRIEHPDGSLRAVVFGYACHCTTLTGKDYRIGGDWAGYAQEYLERAHPGAIALFVTGCGGDANPEPRGKLVYAREHGLEMAGAVSQVLNSSLTPVAGPVKSVLDRVELPFAKLPSREDLQKRLQSKDAFVRRNARLQLETLDQEGKLPSGYPCPVQVWQFGKDLTLVAMGGEVVVDYDLRLKRELPGNLWVAAYANDVFAYVPSVRILLEGGYEADYNLIYYGQPGRFGNNVEEILVRKVHDQVGRVRP